MSERWMRQQKVNTSSSHPSQWLCLCQLVTSRYMLLSSLRTIFISRKLFYISFRCQSSPSIQNGFVHGGGRGMYRVIVFCTKSNAKIKFLHNLITRYTLVLHGWCVCFCVEDIREEDTVSCECVVVLELMPETKYHIWNNNNINNDDDEERERQREQRAYTQFWMKLNTKVYAQIKHTKILFRDT